MYAVIETGGKQYRVELGTELEVELLDAEPGQDITLDRVLLVADGERAAVGRPIVTDATVSARVLRQDRGVKTVSFKYRPKARSRVKKGHRQELTVLRITDVRLGDHSAAADAEQAQAQQQSERDRIAEAAARQAAEDAALAAKLASRRQTTSTETPAGEAEAKPKRSRSRAAQAPEAEAAEASDSAEPSEATEGPGPVASEETSESAAPKRRSRTKKDE